LATGKKVSVDRWTVHFNVFNEGGHGVGNLIPQGVKRGCPPAKWPDLILKWLESLPEAAPSKRRCCGFESCRQKQRRLNDDDSIDLAEVRLTPLTLLGRSSFSEFQT
jgi:hypothetical protein